MDIEQKLTLFKTELELITDSQLIADVIGFLTTKVPDYFWEVPASSTGKYHPKFSSGKRGLIRHTKMAVQILTDLLQLNPYSVDTGTKNCLYAAVILHDTFKHGYNEGHTITSHPTIAADEWANFVGNDKMECDTYLFVYYCILCHMGQWGPESSKRKLSGPIQQAVSLVHLADYLSSKKFFDLDFEDTYDDNK